MRAGGMLEKGAVAVSGKENVFPEKLKGNIFRENFLMYLPLIAK